jgi:hypothetical protein
MPNVTHFKLDAVRIRKMREKDWYFITEQAAPARTLHIQNNVLPYTLC